MMSANSTFVLVSRSFDRVSTAWCVADVFILFLVLCFSEVLEVPPPTCFGCLCVFMLFLVWRSEVRFREAALRVNGCVGAVCVGVCGRPACRPYGGCQLLGRWGVGCHGCVVGVSFPMLCLCFDHMVRVCSVLCSA